MATAFVCGALANKHLNGGAAWTRLSWVLGLKRLGFDVHFLEQIDAINCVDSSGRPASFEDSINLSYFRNVTSRFNLADASTLVYEGGRETSGLDYQDLIRLAGDCQLLINITGHLSLNEIKQPVKRKVYIDLDPGFTQLWHARGDKGPRLEGHDFYFTVGQNIGTSRSPIPVGKIRWNSVLPPVVLEEWPIWDAAEPDRFTTVASWRGPYGPVEYGGQTFGLKVHEFRKFIEIPNIVPQTFEIALEIQPEDARDAESLRDHGWHLVDPRAVVPDPDTFRAYVQASGAEFSVAQGIYVQTGSGWFSDRTARYLASGKPALVQDTGIGPSLPSGEGLVTFSTMSEAVSGARDIAARYPEHCEAARATAERHLDSDMVLGELIDRVGLQ